VRRPSEILPNLGNDKLDTLASVQAVRDDHLDLLERDFDHKSEEGRGVVVRFVHENLLRVESGAFEELAAVIALGKARSLGSRGCILVELESKSRRGGEIGTFISDNLDISSGLFRGTS
jgi:hypothetical protein